VTIWVTSDQHYGHGRVIESCARPFRDVAEMTEELVARHNDCVAPSDVVWHLGDFSFLRPLESASLLRRLHGEHHLVLGNHDRSRSKMLEIGFASVQMVAQIVVRGVHVGMRHVPPDVDAPLADVRRVPSRFVQPVEGAVILCGHAHRAWVQRENVHNVGIDVREFAPVNIEELASDPR